MFLKSSAVSTEVVQNGHWIFVLVSCFLHTAHLEAIHMYSQRVVITKRVRGSVTRSIYILRLWLVLINFDKLMSESANWI